MGSLTKYENLCCARFAIPVRNLFMVIFSGFPAGIPERGLWPSMKTYAAHGFFMPKPHLRASSCSVLGIKKPILSYRFSFAEKEGFEPPDLLQSTVFKTAAFDHSAISPERHWFLNCGCKYRELFRLQQGIFKVFLKIKSKILLHSKLGFQKSDVLFY